MKIETENYKFFEWQDDNCWRYDLILKDALSGETLRQTSGFDERQTGKDLQDLETSLLKELQYIMVRRNR